MLGDRSILLLLQLYGGTRPIAIFDEYLNILHRKGERQDLRANWHTVRSNPHEFSKPKNLMLNLFLF